MLKKIRQKQVKIKVEVKLPVYLMKFIEYLRTEKGNDINEYFEKIIRNEMISRMDDLGFL